MKQPAKPKPAINDVLSSRYFHGVKDNKLGWQGQVIGRVSEELYLVQLYEWLGGSPNVQRLVALSEMREWLFYSSAEEMQFSYEHGTAKHLAPKKP